MRCNPKKKGVSKRIQVHYFVISYRTSSKSAPHTLYPCKIGWRIHSSKKVKKISGKSTAQLRVVAIKLDLTLILVSNAPVPNSFAQRIKYINQMSTRSKNLFSCLTSDNRSRKTNGLHRSFKTDIESNIRKGCV